MKKVTIYSTPTCGHCGQLKMWLTEKGVKYDEFNVQMDEKARDFIVRKSGQMGVPVTIITDDKDGNEAIVIGFDPVKIAELLEIN